MKPQEFMEKLRGTYCHLLTSYKTDNIWEVDHKVMRSNLKYMIDNGCKVIDVTGGAGEAANLTNEERLECCRDIVEVGKGKCLRIAGVGCSSTKECIQLSQEAEKIGIDGLMLVGPWGQFMDEEGLYQHFKKIAENTSLGILIYNSSVLTHRANVNPFVMDRLADIPNIIGIKDSSENVDEYFAHIRNMEKHHKILVYGNSNKFFYPAGALTSDIVVGATSAFATWDPVGQLAFYDAVSKKDTDGIADWFRRMEGFYAFMGAMRRTHPNAHVFKAPLDFIEGVSGGAVRPPNESLTDAEKAQLKEILKKMGLKVRP